MAKTLIVAAALLGMASAAQAAEYSWTSSASLINGGPNTCGYAPYPDYKITMKGNMLMAGPTWAQQAKKPNIVTADSR